MHHASANRDPLAAGFRLAAAARKVIVMYAGQIIEQGPVRKGLC
jgi:hypothetical protein